MEVRHIKTVTKVTIQLLHGNQGLEIKEPFYTCSMNFFIAAFTNVCFTNSILIWLLKINPHILMYLEV